jgi:CubicO group peptidase (beta-lactamase class C family)
VDTVSETISALFNEWFGRRRVFQVVAPETVGMSGGRLDRINGWMQHQVDSGRLPGLSLLVHRKGQVAFFNCVGQRDVEAGQPVTEDTIFRIYSMTKPITAVAAMMLYEQGCFQLSDPIEKFLPEFVDMQVWDGQPGDMRLVPAEGSITVRHLMTHTSGLTYGFMEATPVDAFYRENGISFEYLPDKEPNATLADMTTRLARAPLIAQPGTRWNYSVSIDVLGRLVEVWSGMPLDRFFEERIFTPLRMTDTAFHVAAENIGRFAACYGPATGEGLGQVAAASASVRDGSGVGLKLIDAPATSRFAQPVGLFSGGGGLTGTIGDYARFCQMLANGGELDGARLLGRKTVEFMATNHLPNGGDMASMGQPVWSEASAVGTGYGLGMAVVVNATATEVMRSDGEYNWGGAASTTFWIDPAEELFAVLMTQLLPSSFYPLRSEIRTLVYQSLID